MSESRTVLRNTGILAMARVIERGGNLIIAFLVSRELGVAALGVYVTVIAYYQLITTAGEMGSTNLLIRQISRDRSRTSSYVVHAAAMAVCLSVLGMAIAWTLIPHLGYSRDLTVGLAVIVLAILPGVLNTIQEAVFVSHQRVEFETLTTLAVTVVTIIASWLLLAHGHGVVSLIVTFVVTEYAATLVYFVVINRSIARLRFEFRRQVASEIFREIRPFAGSSLLGALLARPEVLILSLVSSERQAGLYIAALKLVDFWQLVPQVYMTNVFPALSRSHHVGDGRVQEIQDAAATHLIALSFPVAVGLFVGAGPIIAALYGPGFTASIPILRFLAFNACLYGLHSVLWRVLAARGEQGRVLRVQLVTLVVRLALGFALISRYGGAGAAIGVALGLALHCALLARAISSDGTRVRLVGRPWRLAGSAGLMGVVLIGLMGLAPMPVSVVVAGLVYLACLSVTGAVRADSLALLRPSPIASPGGTA